MSKQYGLIDPKAIKASKTVLKKPAVFASDSDSDDSAVPNRSIKAELGESRKRAAARVQEKALAEDPTIYQYDELYDEMDDKRKAARTEGKSKEERKPKYIEKLLETAGKRKKEQERRIERQVQKEREAEGEMFKDKESFVTSAYRAKLEEMKTAEEQEKREEYLEKIGDVTKQSDLGGFYRHIYSQKLGEKSAKSYKDEPTEDKENSSESDNESKSGSEPEPEKTSRKSVEQTKQTEASHSRQYRKRLSGEEEHNDVEKNDHSKKVHLHSNLDADSDFSIDSNSSSSDTGSSSGSSDSEDEGEDKTEPADGNIVGKKKTQVDPENGKSTNGVEHKKEVESRNGTGVTTSGDSEPHKVEKNENVPKVDIWKKRTVGAIFDAALQRYYERKAARESG